MILSRAVPVFAEYEHEAEVYAVQEQQGAYSCDFTRLVKNGEDTMYGNEGDIISLDGYTAAVPEC